MSRYQARNVYLNALVAIVVQRVMDQVSHNMKSNINMLEIMAKTMKVKFKSLIVIALLCGAQGFAVAEVSMPNGEYHSTIEDLKVKVLGGYVKASRTWYQGKWHHTRAFKR